MCGIAGFVGVGGRSEIEAMTAALAHRGPDGGGIHHHSPAALWLGHRRLAVIDLADGAQPMSTADGGLAVVFNGEIYNFRELRAELEAQGHRFLSDHSDTEVLLHGYREWGSDLPSRLNGMWAFAIHDCDRGCLFMSRDRFGKKPFYYHHRDGFFAFASELHALSRHPGVPSATDPTSLMKYFAYGFVPAPRTIRAGVSQLPGGCSATYDIPSGRFETRRYWEFRIEPFERIPKDATEAWSEELRHRIDGAVQRRMIADVPLGVLLSGGLDSSTVAVFAARRSPAPLRTFSIGFEEASFDESIFAAEVARFVGSKHHCQTLALDQAADIATAILPRLDPVGDASILPTFLLCRETRRHVTVALGGDGGDELFAGYDPFRALAASEWYRRLVPAGLRPGIRRLVGLLPVSHRNMSLDFKLKRFLRGVAWPRSAMNPVWLSPLDPDDIADLFGQRVPWDELYSEAVSAWSSATGGLVDRTLEFYTRFYLQDGILFKVDRASMLNSLEVRSPFLDVELVDFVRRIPAEFKLRGGITKFILKKAMAPLLPAGIATRAKKGFGVPVGQWLREGKLDPLAHGLPPGMDRAAVATRVDRHRTGRSNERLFLWALLACQQWHYDKHADGVHSPP
jgi:asparagine synthase (glutamine-hydrolysing)